MSLIRLFLIISLLQSIVYAPFNLYDTDRTIGTGRLQFDCLHYYVGSESVDLRYDNSIKQVIKYCLRPMDEINVSLFNHNTHGKTFTFEELHLLNVTVLQLLSWSASIDLVERYLLYTKQPILSRPSDEWFHNCTKPWFGSLCQYSFVVDDDQSFSVIVERIFNRKKKYEDGNVNISSLTCYTHLQCDRGESHLCLDWREICNGRIDCANGGVDESQCLELEINECNEDEYRCHNGLCIPKDFWQDDENNPDCLDRSDEPNILSSFDLCFQIPTFRCEEHACRPGKSDFSCGDGQCVEDFDPCHNGRTHLLTQSLLVKDGLPEKCWIYMACFALIVQYYDENLCRSVIRSLHENKTSHLSACKNLFQFPTTYALNGHIRFMYYKNRSVVFTTQTISDGKVMFITNPSSSLYNHDFSGSKIRNPNSIASFLPNPGGSVLWPSNPNGWGSLIDYLTPIDFSGIDNMMKDLHETMNRLFSNSYAEKCGRNGSTIKYQVLDIERNRPKASFFGPECYSFGNLDMLTYFQILLPDYVCYNETLCNFIQPTFRHKKLACQHRQQVEVDDTNDYKEFTLAIKDYFRGCSIPYRTAYGNQPEWHSSAYCCRKSSKCISKHRLVDGILDCDRGDDENYKHSCSLNDTYRFRCDDKKKQCFSPLVGDDVCQNQLKDSINKIYFQYICDGIDDMFPEQVGEKSHTDETECEYWPCDRTYTKCDNIRACHDGRDENDCINSYCSTSSHPCISIQNHTLICLRFDQINDGTIDCLGASDETEYCLSKRDNLRTGNTFYCGDGGKCISSLSLCDLIKDCPDDDDEKFCGKKRKICSERPISSNRTEIENVICQIFRKRKDNAYFSLENSPVYPLLVESTPQSDERLAERLLVRRNTNELDGDYEDKTDEFTWKQRCNRGLYARTLVGSTNYSYSCFCPPSYYGDSCEYQNQRVSLTLRLLPVDRHSVYAIVVKLIDDDGQINSYEQFTFMAIWGCRMKFNIYLLYSTRPKEISKNYSVRIDAFDKGTLRHNASWYLSIPFAFLPVNRLVAQLVLPVQGNSILHLCNLTCNNRGQCMKYENTQDFFCLCLANWTGHLCDIPFNCVGCSTDSICVGKINNRSICVCPSDEIGPRCLLPAVCPLNACENNGRCLLIDGDTGTDNFLCLCSDEYYGSRCELSKRKLDIFLDNIKTPSYLQVFIFTVFNETSPSSLVMVKKLTHDQNIVSFYISKPFHMVFVKIINDYYLAVVRRYSRDDVSTSISPTQRCRHIHELFNDTIMALPSIRRIKRYPLLCRNRTNSWCFFDGIYMCLCTFEHYPNCFLFNHQTNLACKQSGYCKNDALCLQDDPTCPSNTICICTDCYFGIQCQFYAKGFGVTLDDILRYEIRPNLILSQQRISRKITLFTTMLMFALGIINGILSCLTFVRKSSRQVGCGLYLFASSITSILTIIVFTLKCWFLVLSQMNWITNNTFLRIGCISIEPSLKTLLYIDTWFKACVAIERAIAVFKGVKFNKKSSKQIGKRVIFVLPLSIIATIGHEFTHRDLFDDEEEQRIWCVTYYSRYLQNYNAAILVFHFAFPFLINLSSALFIIVNIARQRSVSQTEQSYSQHLLKQLSEHKHILIGPLALVTLASPRLVISLLSTCIKSSREPWLYLSGYFISFIPPVVIFIVFVLPSELYSKSFKEATEGWRQLFKK